MNANEFAELSAGYALGALSPADERAYLDALAAHPQWQTGADADVATSALMAGAVADVAPPAHLRDSILAKVAASPVASAAPDAPAPAMETVTATASEASTRPNRRLGRLVFALAACLVLLAGVGIGAVSLSNWLNRPAAVVALEQIEGAADARTASVELADGGVATAHWAPSVGQAVIVTDGIGSIPADKSFELWFVRGDAPISAGTFEVGDGGRATALLQGEMQAGDVIAVTIEPAGGSPNGLPSTDPIVVIPTA